MSVTVLVLPGVAGRKTAAVLTVECGLLRPNWRPGRVRSQIGRMEWSSNQDKISVSAPVASR